MSSVNDDILHYQKKIEKYSTDTKVVLHCLNKLAKLPIGVQHLQATGIGRTINGMRKVEGAVGEEAKALVNKWKQMVADEDDKSDSDEAAEEETNQHEIYSDQEYGDETQEEELERKSKHKSSRKERTKEEAPSTSKGKSSTSKSKSLEKSSKSSKSSEKRKECKDKEEASSSHNSKSRKRQHSEDEDSPSHDDDSVAPVMSFEDALGSIETSSKKKKSKDKDKDKDKEKHKSDKRKHVPSASDILPSSSSSTLFPPAPALPPPKRIEISALDFGTSPDYKPLPRPANYSNEAQMGRHRTTEEALSAAMAQKGSRTKVFSGNRSSGLTYVPTLFECCIRVLQQNIDSLEFTGGVPYELLRPVLERASAQQLYNLEHYNPYLLDDTDELWKVQCQKEFRKAVREEMETWRDLYLRCFEERDARLKSLAANHKQSIAKATPIRTTKLAYVESVARAPRGVSKPGQVKQGASAVLASMTNAKGTGRPFEASVNRSSNDDNTPAEIIKMGPPAASRASSSSSAPANKKPKVAPLMQKTLKLMKNRFRR